MPRRHRYGTTPWPLITDSKSTVLEQRLYAYLDAQSGPRGYWDDSLVALARTLEASRYHLGRAAKRLEEKGWIVREQRGHWQTRFVVVERVAGDQLALDEHPVELRGGDSGRGTDVPREGAGGDPMRVRNGALYLSSNKEVLRKKGRQVQQKRAGDEYNRNTRTAWPA